MCTFAGRDTFCYTVEGCAAAGFTWLDTLPAPCTGITSVIIHANEGFQCNYSYTALSTTLNDHTLTSAADLSLGPQFCECGRSLGQDDTVTLTGVDIQAYAIRGMNTITFDSIASIGFLADSAGTFATIAVSGS